MSSYKEAGVDQDAADALIPVFASLARRTRGEVSEAFAGLFPLGDGRALACSIDGVGTKVELLARAGLHHVAGWDAVAMNVDDVVCCGATPLLVLDYVSVDRLVPEVVTQIVSGVADACVEAGCALVGGETSQHPGLLPPGGYDVVAVCAGTVDAAAVWGPSRVAVGDAIVGIASTGPHSNGFSLVRKIAGDSQVPPQALLPTAIYAPRLLSLARAVEVHAAAHVTGGGIAGNLRRVVPPSLGARIERGTWTVPEIFSWIADRGDVPRVQMEATFNMGLGMLVVTPSGDDAAASLRSSGVDAWIVGEVASGGDVGLV